MFFGFPFFRRVQKSLAAIIFQPHFRGLPHCYNFYVSLRALFQAGKLFLGREKKRANRHENFSSSAGRKERVLVFFYASFWRMRSGLVGLCGVMGGCRRACCSFSLAPRSLAWFCLALLGVSSLGRLRARCRVRRGLSGWRRRES